VETIILASSSPRRRELLTRIHIPFVAADPEIDEDIRENNPEKLVTILAALKVEAVLKKKPVLETRWVLGADTIVLHGKAMIGKPADKKQARKFLQRLSGDTHKVLTGLALHEPGGEIKTSVTATSVTFSRMEPEEIEWYVSTGEWKGAAGGYRIQERGGLFVHSISGSSTNVVGLPISTFYGMLRSAKYQFKAT